MQTVRWNFADQLPQLEPAPLVANSAGNADMQVEIQIGVQLCARTGEAMPAAGDTIAISAQQCVKIGVCLADGVETDGSWTTRCQLELGFEREELRSARREIAVVVEAGTRPARAPMHSTLALQAWST